MLRKFFTQSWLCFKGQQSAFSFEEFLLLDTTYPFLSLVFYCLIAKFSYQTSNLTYWVIGNSFLLCVNSCIFNVGNSFAYERRFGCLKSIIVSPRNLYLIIIEKGFFPSIVSIITVSIGTIAGCILFKIDFSDVNLVAFGMTILIAMISATSFGLVLAVIGLLTDGIHFVLNIFSGLLILFSGANFPISQLPFLAQQVSKILPLSRSIEAANLIFNLKITNYVWGLLAQELILGIIYSIIAFFLLEKIEKIAIKKAVLEIF